MDHNISCIADGSTELFSELPILCGVQPEEKKMEQKCYLDYPFKYFDGTLQKLASEKGIHRKTT